ncbi:PQQ-binding-like beta-propeller repeat protein [Mycolicibacterium litorale]|uniref:outer membrane protein assembly factor BamB family protein n=1 Tax=Mycolicibacterium litorale TaxID=758802 RepID=UPI003CFAD475
MSTATTVSAGTYDQRSLAGRASRWLIACSVGLAVGAIGLIGYAYGIRIPEGGRAADTLEPVGGFFVWYLILAVIMTVLMLWAGIAALTGSDARRFSAILLAATVALTGWVYLSSTPSSIADRISGPGARPAVPMAQFAWPLLAVAALMMLLGVVYAAGASLSVPRALLALLSPFTVLGVVLSVVAGTIVATWWERGQVHSSTVEPTAVPALPIEFGNSVAYTVGVADPERIVPAGPGFVVFDQGGGITAYDGTTGVQRWSVAADVFPAGCGLRAVRSTGTAADSVVIADCTRPQKHPLPENANDDDRREPVLLGFDANTGRLLWLTDQNFGLASGAGQSASLVAVTRRDEVGSLDPKTGVVRWVQKACESADVVGDDLVMDGCSNENTLRVLDGATGEERTIDLPLPDSNRLGVDSIRILTLAADRNLLIYGVRISHFSREAAGPRHEYSTLAVDVATGQSFIVPSVEDRIPNEPRPGPGLQLATGGRPGEQPFTEVYWLPERQLVRAQGFTAYSRAGDGQQWAQIGDRLVSAAVNDGSETFVASVAADGTTTRSPWPCPARPARDTRGAGIVAVPGATLVLCPPPGDERGEWSVLGMR